MPGSPEDRLDELESRVAISALVANYCHGLDLHDLDLVESIWHHDAEFMVGEPIGDLRGREAILAGVEKSIWGEFLPVTHHWTTNLVVEFEDADHATGLSSVNTVATAGGGGKVTLAATYRDRFERRDGEWRIAERRCETHYQLPLPDPSGA